MKMNRAVLLAMFLVPIVYSSYRYMINDYEKENLQNQPSKFFTIFQNLVILVCVGAGGGGRMKKDSWQCVV